MNSTSAPTPFSNKSYLSRHSAAARRNLPPRPATSPALPTPPVPPKDTNVTIELKAPCPPPKNTVADHRWSEVVPPATALTFAAIWDPEDGLVTFSGASLSASVNGDNKASPEDADACSQVLTVDFLNLGTAPSTAKDSLLFPYSQSRFAASEVSTPGLPISPTRRSSVGTGLAIESSICPELEKQMQINAQHGRTSDVRHLAVPTTKAGKPLRPRAEHKHSSSQDSGTSHTLSVFGSNICSAFRRVATPKQGPSRAERYAFLRRTSEKTDGHEEHNEKARIHADRSPPNTPPKSPGFRSIFARSVWLRGGVATGRDERLFARPHAEDDCDGISLDSGFDCLDVDDSAYETWHGEHGGGSKELDNALQRDVNKLKSTFSWTTTSTSRYIDVAAYLENDSDTDSTVSSLGAPIASTASPFHSQQANSLSVHAQEGGCESPWLPIDPPTPRPGISTSQHPKPLRNVLRKLSKSQVGCASSADAPCKSAVTRSEHERQHYQVCPQCHLQIECVDLEAKQTTASSNKGKARANSQPDLPDSVRNTVCFGRPAAIRSSSYPASLPFSHHSRSQSLPGSRAASPAEVLARASYNHEWASPIPSRPISHVRSPSAPQPGSPVTSMSSHQRSTTPTQACHHFTDVRDVLRGVRSGIRPSTPIPGMPPIPPKNRPPPTSYRPISAGGRERGPSGSPMSSYTRSHGHASELTRSRSHRTSDQPPSSRPLRTRSLESLRGTAHALASASTAPLRSLLRARSFIRHSHSDQPKRSDASSDEEGVWICVDIKSSDSKARTMTSPEVQSPGTIP